MDAFLETEVVTPEETEQTITKGRGISGSTLKIIAIVAMFIDHTAAIILDRLLMARGMGSLNGADTQAVMEFLAENGAIYYLDMAMRLIGRLGFPIFCFLLIEGFLHTRNVKKYALNLGIFALVSEIPFNLGFSGNLWFAGYQNVFFMLLIGMLLLIDLKWIGERFIGKKIPFIGLSILVVAIGMVLAALLKTDYSHFGGLTIVVMYWFRKKRMVEMAMGCLSLTVMSFIELPAFLTLIPISKYNGKRGFSLKYVFYAFYPVHILILHFITVWMGIA